jgi:predicted RNase H-like HicB family nuclease
MDQKYTALIKRDAGWWIGWIEEIPGVNCQEASREELMTSLRATLREALDFNRQEALGAAGGDFEEEQIAETLRGQ